MKMRVLYFIRNQTAAKTFQLVNVMNLLCVLSPSTVCVDTFVLVGLTVNTLVFLDQSLAINSPKSGSDVVLVRF